MSVNLNKIRKDFNGAVSEIPEDRLKVLFYKLYYELFHHLYITGDNEAFQKALKMINTLIKESEAWKRFQAAKGAILETPHVIINELLENQYNESKNIVADLYSIYIVILATDMDFSRLIIEYIDICKEGDEKRCLEVVKKNLQEFMKGTGEILRINSEMIEELIKHLEDKKQLSEHETETLTKLKELVDLRHI